MADNLPARSCYILALAGGAMSVGFVVLTPDNFLSSDSELLNFTLPNPEI
jgi:hypothetical protein